VFHRFGADWAVVIRVCAARANMDAVLVFLVGRFQLKDSMTRVGSLVVLRHLVNALGNRSSALRR
jgi:hypothetical protein